MAGGLQTLRGFVFASTLAITLAVFVGVTLVASLLYENVMARQAQEAARGVAQQTFNGMFQVMRRGWTREELEEFLEATRLAFVDTPYEVDIFRGDKVEQLYGTIDQPSKDALILEVFANGQERVSEQAGVLRFVYPMAARAECLACHSNVADGDVLGVIDLRHDMQPISAEMRRNYIVLFLGFGLLVLLAAGGSTLLMARRIDGPVKDFGARLDAVNSVKDFRELDITDVDLHFDELNQAFGSINVLVEKLQDIAVDKDILEFEIRLLGKFIITSDVVRDWREFIKDLLIDINTIITAYSLVTIFQVEEEGYELEVFWHHAVSDEARSAFEKIVTRRLESDVHFRHGAPILSINHHVADPDSNLPELTPQDIELQTKSLLLETPKIGGVVGIGVQSEMVQDPIRHIVIGSILTTLLNLVGSVKAIFKYTKDLEYYATRDPLTHLHNQRMFWELIGYEVGRATRHDQSFGLLMLDLDNFKTINDRYGHAFGDQFLQGFAKVLEESVRPGDFVSRYGGDEFTILLPEAGEEQAHMVAQRIATALEKLVINAPDGTPVRATTSIGIAIYPDHGGDPRDLFLMADNMMYKAKRGGKNHIAIPDENEIAEVFKEVGEKNLMILNALEERRIIPFFQPIVDSHTGEVLIHELLMRIQIEDRIVSAYEFIDVAEKIGVVHKMDYQLIEQAFRQIHEQGYDGMLFINLSPKSLIVGEFIAKVRQLALVNNVDPGRIVFELTERETVSNLTLLERFVLDLKLEGFNFAIDDFGSGFSSFHYIKHFPIDVIKIEGEFIRNMLQDDKYLAFVKSIVTLAKELKVRTIAEFVEDEAVMDAVRDFGIDYAQGYHVGKPGPTLYPKGTRLTHE